jgi:hypothetical protein
LGAFSYKTKYVLSGFLLIVKTFKPNFENPDYGNGK